MENTSVKNTSMCSRHRSWFIVFLTLGIIGVLVIGTGAMWRASAGTKIASPLLGLFFHPFVILVWFGIAWYEYRQMRADQNGASEDRTFMSASARTITKKAALAGAILFALYVAVAGGLVIAENRSLASRVAQETPIAQASDNAFIVSYVSDARGRGDGSSVEVSSAASDGTNAKVVGLMDSALWGEESHAGVFESMGNYYGDFTSPDGKKMLSVEFGRSNLLTNVFSIPKLYVTTNGEKALLLNGGFTEVEWFPDSRRIAVTDGDSIYVLDTEKHIKSFLTNGNGFLSIKSRDTFFPNDAL